MIESLTSIAQGEIPISEIYSEINTLKSVDPSEITLKKISEKVTGFYEYNKSKAYVRSSGCGSFLAAQIIALNLEEENNPSDEDIPLADKVKKVESAIRHAHKATGYKWEDIKNGFYAEAAMALTLNNLGFQVNIPDPVDDPEGKIDLLVTDPEEKENPFLITLQVKNSVNLKEGVIIENANNLGALIHRIEDNWDYSGNYEAASDRLEHLINSLDISTEQMLQYLPSSDNFHMKIIPIIAIISGGEGSKNSMYNVRTGSPMGGTFEEGSMATKVYEELSKIIYTKERT
ncbi:hypothetical protein K0B04_01145 [Patescibacteria group bacterium]|nr:hypothetical protein [Patescibacteria group bacterium]